MVLRHAGEKFRRAYQLPLDENESSYAFKQYTNITVDNLDENTYRYDILAKYDLWRKKKLNADNDELIDYHDLDDSFYDNVMDNDDDASDYDSDDDSSPAALLYQWHRDRHFDVHNSMTKYVDNKMINITVIDLVKSLPQFNRSNYRANRLSFDLFRPYAYLLEEKYRGRTGHDGMMEFYFEPTNVAGDLLSIDHLRSLCTWESKLKDVLSLPHVPSLSLATFVALYSSKNDCRFLSSEDVQHFRSVLSTCLPYYINGYMDIPLSEQFLGRVKQEQQMGYFTYKKQVKAVYTTLRHTCFYKNITRFIFDHFVDRDFLNDLQRSETNSKVSISMIFISNYRITKYNRMRDQTMCLRQQQYSRKYCQERGCMHDYKMNLTLESCANQAPPEANCEEYCRCKHQCVNETEQVTLLTPILKEKELIEFFEKHMAGKRKFSTYRNQFIKLTSLNLAYIREKAAMEQVYTDMFLTMVSAGLIVGLTVLYLRSVAIALMLVINAGLTLGVAYFTYRVIYRIPIFPTMNFVSVFILIGIACDDIFVFFDTWDHEKAEWLRRYRLAQQVDNADIPLSDISTHEIPFSHEEVKPDTSQNPRHANQIRRRSYSATDLEHTRQLLLSEEILIEVMSKTLKHAASSMFVTSFTTSAAFVTNILTNISFIQVFGIFTGTCILLYFVLTITAMAAFAVIYDKYIQNIPSHLFAKCSSESVHTFSCNSVGKLCQRFTATCKRLRDYSFCHLIPMLLIKLRYVLVPLLICVGMLGLIGVFYYPKIQIPLSQRVPLFVKDHPLETYEIHMKSRFNGYIKEERRLFAYPTIFFVFGVRDIDDGYVFDMNDRGRLHLTPIYLYRQTTLDFFKQFIAHLGTRKDLFAPNDDLRTDFDSFYQIATEDTIVEKFLQDQMKQNVSRMSHLDMIKYIGKINTSLIEHLVFTTLRTSSSEIDRHGSAQNKSTIRKLDQMNITLYQMSTTQLAHSFNPTITYSNYQTSFNRTLEKIYKEQLLRNYDLRKARTSLNDTIRDALMEEYQQSAFKTAMQCLTGTAGANNLPIEFCESQLKKQRSNNWVVLLDKPSPNDGSIQPFAAFIAIRGTLNRTDYDSYSIYYRQIKDFFDPYLKQYAPEHLKHAWFGSPDFVFFGIQQETVVGTYSSLITSLVIALLVLFVTSGNLFIAFYALMAVTLAIAVTAAVFAILKWQLGIVEAIVMMMAVGLSVDFVVHFGVAYIHADPNSVDQRRRKVKNRSLSPASELNDNDNHSQGNTCCSLRTDHQAVREACVKECVSRVGSAVLMAAFTTFVAGFSMTPATVTAFRQMGQFLMTIMLTSWMFAMFFFLPLCAILGPVGTCGSIPFSRIGTWLKRCVCRR